jgi:DNA-binding transcriptional ArsR family regulator
MTRTTDYVLRTLLHKSDLVNELASFFKVFGDATRLRLLAALLASPSRVGDLSRDLGMTQSAVSHQMRLLKDERLVRGARLGKEITYSLDDAHIIKILTDGFAHVSERRQKKSGRG